MTFAYGNFYYIICRVCQALWRIQSCRSRLQNYGNEVCYVLMANLNVQLETHVANFSPVAMAVVLNQMLSAVVMELIVALMVTLVVMGAFVKSEGRPKHAIDMNNLIYFHVILPPSRIA